MSSSPYKSHDPEHRRKAIFMLEKLLPLSQKLAEKDPAKVEVANPLAAQGFPHWRLSNVFGVHIYQTSRGWYSDIIFKEVPLGIASVIGTPLAHPHPTRFLAEENAIGILSLMIQADQGKLDIENRFKVNPGDIIFDLDGLFLTIPKDLIETIPKDLIENATKEFSRFVNSKSQTFAEEILYLMLEEDFPDQELSEESWDALSFDRKKEYCIQAVIMAVMSGRNRIRRGIEDDD